MRAIDFQPKISISRPLPSSETPNSDAAYTKNYKLKYPLEPVEAILTDPNTLRAARRHPDAKNWSVTYDAQMRHYFIDLKEV